MKHKQYNDLLEIVRANIPLHMISESGVGKSTIAEQIANDLGLEYTFIGCTKGTSEGKIIGFNSISTLKVVKTLFREAVEEGKVFCLEELTAIDPNTILILNSLDNGMIAFPDKIIRVHPNFRLIATSNPVTSEYGARDELDFSTKNRYMEVWLEKDENLSEHLSSKESMSEVSILRDLLRDNGSPKQLTMRDEIRLSKLTTIGIKDPLMRLIDTEPKELKDTIRDSLKSKQEEIKQKIKDKIEQERKDREKAEAEAEEAKLTQHDMEDLESFIKKVKEGK